MKNRYVFRDFEPRINEEKVFRLLNCQEGSDTYETFREEYEELIPTVTGKMDALALVKTEDEKMYIFLTVGEKLDCLASEYFQQGDYVRGMLADAMADTLLFEIEHQLMAELKEITADMQVGVKARLEAPTDFPMEMQKEILDHTGAGEFGVSLSSGYMFRPVKSSGFILELTNDMTVFKSQHDCRKCPKKDCPLRGRSGKTVRVLWGKRELEIPFQEGENLLQILRRGGVTLSAPCGGEGRCGKCAVRVCKGRLAVTEADRKFFTEEDLNQGMRLACKAFPEGTLYIEVGGDSGDGFDVVGAESSEAVADTVYGIAVDLGTTTLALALVGMQSGGVKASWAGVNPQRSYGGDVISRILAATNGKDKELQKVIREALCVGINTLLKESAVTKAQVKRLVISGNTTMQHLLLGYPCETLGTAPFRPFDIDFHEMSCEMVLGEPILDCPVWILPGISTYVGSDISAGILHCGMDQADQIRLILDFGTNGEMALGNKDKLLVTSTAAGPAFEGGNISCGTGSIPGAINSVEIYGEKIEYRTIQNIYSPVGICGTGVIEMAAELLKAGWMDETGYLDDRWDEEVLIAQGSGDNRIIFTQKDIREIQLAKAAMRAGMEVLLKHFEITWEQVDEICLAGGFGFYVDLEKIISLGMLPEEARGKIKVMGNTSLKGAIDCLLLEAAKARLAAIAKSAKEVSLAEDKDFQNIYVEEMYFPEI